MQSVPRRGTVYGTLLNHHDALAAMGGAVHESPYKSPPQAPILYIKPRNTWLAAGEAIVVPEGVESIEVGATLGLVIGRSACRVGEADALSYIAGYVIVNDVSMPHASYYRPSLRFKARGTFCPIGPFVPRHATPSARLTRWIFRSPSTAGRYTGAAPQGLSGRWRACSPKSASS